MKPWSHEAKSSMTLPPCWPWGWWIDGWLQSRLAAGSRTNCHAAELPLDLSEAEQYLDLSTLRYDVYEDGQPTLGPAENLLRLKLGNARFDPIGFTLGCPND